jgi:preprotein translocase subunit YajC
MPTDHRSDLKPGDWVKTPTGIVGTVHRIDGDKVLIDPGCGKFYRVKWLEAVSPELLEKTDPPATHT